MEEVSNDFKDNVIKYIRYDDLINEKMNEIKELKERKKIFEKYILDFLIKENENVVNVGDDKIRRIDIKTKSKKPIKIEQIQEVLSNNNIKDDVIDKVINELEKQRSKIHYNLRRIKKK
jgi:hypothetical protein